MFPMFMTDEERKLYFIIGIVLLLIVAVLSFIKYIFKDKIENSNNKFIKRFFDGL